MLFDLKEWSECKQKRRMRIAMETVMFVSVFASFYQRDILLGGNPRKVYDMIRRIN